MRWLGVSAEGLSGAELRTRQAQFGPNTIHSTAPISRLALLANQLKSLIVALLAIACAAAFATGDVLDAIAIAIVLVLNIAIGYFIELSAARAIKSLSKQMPHHCNVVRDGERMTVDVVSLVPGDIIEIGSGEGIPADARLLSADEVSSNEATLTGESLPVEKDADLVVPENAPLADRRNMLFAGCTVSEGAARAIVVATGINTEFARISELVSEVRAPKTPLERQLGLLGQRLVWVALAVGITASIVAWRRGAALADLLTNGIALAVAAVPEGLPAIATIALALGARRMARRKALVRRIHAVEALGSASIVCTDKTGTLTTATMTVTRVRTDASEFEVTGEGPTPNGQFMHDGRALTGGLPADLAALLECAVVTSDASDATDAALVTMAAKAQLTRSTVDLEILQNVPFTTKRRFSMSIARSDGQSMAFVKGAPELLIGASRFFMTASGDVAVMPECQRTEWQARNHAYAATGQRVIGLARGDASTSTERLSGLTLLGLVAISDPPVAGVRETIQTLSDAGVRTVMITGDQQATASWIGRELGLAEIDVHSRVAPEGKLKIVEALQAEGHVVAMIGDGVNDAAALKRADISVAMGGRGTEVAREAASVVLQDDSFATIVAALEEGRMIFANIRKFVAYLFSCNLAEVFFVFTAGLSGLPMLLPSHLLWLNLLTDTLPAFALAMEPAEPHLLQQKPRARDAAILNRRLMRIVFFYGFLIAAVTVAAVVIAARTRPGNAVSIAFVTLAFAQIFHLGNMRSRSHVLHRAQMLSNRHAIIAVVVSVSLVLATLYVPQLALLLRTKPLAWRDWVIVLPLALLPAVLGQLIAFIRSRKRTTTHALRLLLPLIAITATVRPARSQSIQNRVDQIRDAGGVQIGRAFIRKSQTLLSLYAESGYAALWNEESGAQLRGAIRDVAADGLRPSYYHAEVIDSLAGGLRSAAKATALDVVRTDALIQLMHDLQFGRVKPGVVSLAAARAAIAGDVAREVARLRPNHFVYAGLVRSLAELQQIADSGGWSPLSVGPPLRGGAHGARVLDLRQRLVREGYTSLVASSAPNLFDLKLDTAVRHFQHRHGLNEDGVVGSATAAELNVPVQTRIDQVRVNLERARWVTHDLPSTFVVVNTAGAKVYMMRYRNVVFESRAVVGKDYTKTPVFRATIKQVDLNPTWTVPPGIIREVRALARRDPDYFRRERIRAVGGTFIQAPGPTNPLGRVKFVFPNAYNVYLHDTPARTLFEQEQRMFSHGCIRVQNPFQLAALVINDSSSWNTASLNDAIAADTTVVIPLKEPLPILILYWTAAADLHGELHFYRDAYRRDVELLLALDRNQLHLN